MTNIFEKDKAEAKGFAAGKRGDPVTKCPYECFKGKQTPETMCHSVWMMGWFRGNWYREKLKAERMLGKMR